MRIREYQKQFKHGKEKGKDNFFETKLNHADY